MEFPELRMRRLRRSASLRNMVRETRLDPAGFILPQWYGKPRFDQRVEQRRAARQRVGKARRKREQPSQQIEQSRAGVE